MTEVVAQPKWQNLSAFMMSFASKQFQVTALLIVFEAYVVWLGTHLPGGYSDNSYLALMGVVHGTLTPIIIFWFKNDQEQRKLQSQEKGNANANV